MAEETMQPIKTFKIFMHQLYIYLNMKLTTYFLNNVLMVCIAPPTNASTTTDKCSVDQ